MSEQRERMNSQGYYLQPTVSGDRVVFVSEDDLWEVPLGGGRTRRLTSARGAASHPVFSPDGERLAFTANVEGSPEVFVMDSLGGAARQLTFNGVASEVVDWSADGSGVVYRSHVKGFNRRRVMLYEVSAGGGEARCVPVGTAYSLAREPGGPGRVICRYSDDLARWKRYRGGTAAVLWIDRQGDDQWERLLPEHSAGLIRPMWIGDRVYFVSDLEGHGNLYSCTPDGQDLRRHTDHEGFYVRFPRTDGATIVYACGADLWRYDLAKGEARRVEVGYGSPRAQLGRRFVDAEEFLDDVALHPAGHSLAVTTRGKLFNFGHWEGGVRQCGRLQGVRYRLPAYLPDGERLVVCSDATGEERLEIHRADGSTAPTVLQIEGPDIGRALALEVAPSGDKLAITNHRHELMVIDLGEATARVVDRSDYARIDGVSWSSDGRWLAYAKPTALSTSTVYVYDLEEDGARPITSGRYRDVDPVFDPGGEYLYFLSYRRFNPVYDELFFELSFPRAMVPCVVALKESTESAFVKKPRPLDASEADDDGDGDGREGEGDAEDGSEAKRVEIDFDGIEQRVEAFPVPEGTISELGASHARVFWTMTPLAGSLGGRPGEDDEGGALYYFDFDDGKPKLFASDVTSFRVGPDNKTMVLWTHDGLRVVEASGSGPDDDEEPRPSRATGYIDLGRLSVAVEPHREWEQMLREAWRLMRDHFWREDMSGVDWGAVWERYHPLLARVSTRAEFSDLVWTMQGELGTSHAYEIGGDYDTPPDWRPGRLGVEVVWDPAASFERHGQTLEGGWRIEHVIAAEAWDAKERSPLARAGVRAGQGDVILSVHGRRCQRDVSLQEVLVNQAGREVEVEIGLLKSGGVETYTLRTLTSEKPARYREWVVNNRRRVHEATDGAIGYLHIPDMGPQGFAEFHRGYLAENERRGLIVDVRYNGGGHVSQLILEKLARRHLGYDLQRWGAPMPYPAESIEGPMLALTNEFAGSDGDIFSHCFKLMELGPLMGKRTWGGVIGIWPRHALVDGSVTTQPEFSFWFEDVGFGVENWGTDPDVEVEWPPEADAAGRDTQLEAAIEHIQSMLDGGGGRPSFEPYPDLSPPSLSDER